MRSHYRAAALAISCLALGLANAQTPPTTNPLSRGGPSAPAIGSRLDGPLNPAVNGLARSARPNYGPVTPVPEPSEWLMLLAGLGVVGVIARRSASRRRPDDEQ